MRFCWLALIVLGCKSSRAAPSTRTGSQDEAERGGHTVLIPCPDVTGETLRFHLLEDQHTICNSTYELEQGVPKCTSECNRSDVELHQNEEDKFVGFKVTVSKSPVSYRCEVTKTYPPPWVTTQGAPTTVLLVKGQCGDNPSELIGDEKSPTWPWMWILVVVLISIYGLAVTAHAYITWNKLRRTELHSDYMNTKPRERAAPRKNQKIKNPIHF
ncbi:unnamed protein product [Ophioblennius macclurei]